MASTASRPSNLAGIQLTQDLHHKMSKKLAQLTKVVYALHTRNDEHELTISLTRHEHDDELQRLANDTQARIETYKDAVSRHNEYRVKIEALEASISEHEKQHAAAMNEFERFRADVARDEATLKRQHRDDARRLSDALNSLKSQFEARLAQLRDAEASRSDASCREMKRLKGKQQDEIESLNNSWSIKVGRMEQEVAKFRKIADDARDMVEVVQRDMQAAIERERQFKNTALKDTSDKWKEHVQKYVDKLKEEKAKFAVERESLEKEAEEWKSKWEEQGRKLGDMAERGVDVLALGRELEAARAENAGQEVLNKELRNCLAELKERHEELVLETHNKAGQLGSLETTCSQQQQQIIELTKELSQLRSRSKLLESENGRLVATQKSTNDRQDVNLKILERDLDQARREKRDLKTQYAQELEAAQVRNEQRETEIQQKYITEISTLKKLHQQQLTDEQQQLKRKLAALKDTQAKNLEKEISERNKVQQMINEQEDQFRKRESELEEKIRALEVEIETLRRQVNTGQAGITSASEEMQMVKKQLLRVSVEMHEKEEKIVELQSALKQKQTDIERADELYKRLLSDAEIRSKSEMEALALRLENEWKSKLRDELGSMTGQMTEQHRSNCTKAVDEVSAAKDKEIDELKASTANKMAELHQQLDDTKANLQTAQMTVHDSEAEIAELKAEQDVERMRLEEAHQRALQDMMEKMELEHQQTLEQEENARVAISLEEKQKDEAEHQQMLHNQREELLQEFVKEQSSLEDKHRADLAELESRYQDRVEKLENRSQSLMLEIEQQLLKHGDEIAALGKEQQEEVGRIRTNYEAALTAVQEELDAKKANCHRHMHTLTDHETSITSLRIEVGDWKDKANHLRNTVNAKQNELDEMIADADAKQKQAAVDARIKVEQAREAVIAKADQEMNELQRSFEVAKLEFEGEISELVAQLEAVQQLYDKRESREEDLEMIKELRCIVADQDETIVELKEQQHFFKLELINREKNFNQIFKAAPRVGTIDPLKGKNRRKVKHVISGSLSPRAAARLDPLPGSPTVRHQLRSSRPLPDPFVLERPDRVTLEEPGVV